MKSKFKPGVLAEITFDFKTGKHKVYDDLMGEREVGGKYIDVVRDQLAYLREIQKRGTSPRPQQLVDDIKAYELLLSQPNPEEACEVYGRISDEARSSAFGAKHFRKKTALQKMGIWKD